MPEPDFEKLERLLDQLGAELSALRATLPAEEDGNIPSMRENAQETIAELERALSDPSSVAGILTGFIDLDETLAGLRPGELIVLAARPAMGKSTLLLNVLRNLVLEAKIPAAFFSLQMSRSEVTRRLCCDGCGLPPERMRQGRVHRDEFPRLAAASAKLAEAPLWIDDRLPLHLPQLRRRARLLRQQHGIRIVLIDEIHGLGGASEESRKSPQRETAEVAAGLKSLAWELNLPVLVTSQLNRDVERRRGGRPRLGDLRGSTTFEECADVVALLCREERYPDGLDEQEENGGIARIDVAKNRAGPTGEVSLTYRRQPLRFESRPREDEV